MLYQYFECYTALRCVLELMEMSIKLMDNVLCNELPVLFFFYSVYSILHIVETSQIFVL